jgi:hypothetical protein
MHTLNGRAASFESALVLRSVKSSPDNTNAESEHLGKIAQANITDISAHLYALFKPDFVRQHTDAWIEVAYCKPDEPLHKARTFSVFDLEGAAKFAADVNKRGFNVYVGAALRDGQKPESGRANDKHFLVARYCWAEYDDAGDHERIAAICEAEGLQPAMIAVTGTSPHQRCHLYFLMDQPITDADEIKAANKALKQRFNSDDVENPSRVMRLAGTVNYPKTEKRAQGYQTELTRLHVKRDAPTYSVEALCGLRPASENVHENRSNDHSFAIFGSTGRRGMEKVRELLAGVRPGHWHIPMRDSVAVMVGLGLSDAVIKMICAAHCKDGYDDPSLAKLIDTARAKFDKPDFGEPCENFNENVECAGADTSHAKQCFLTLDQWRDRDLPTPDYLLGEVLSTTSRAIMSAPTGLGKSNVAIAIGMRMAAGASFLHWEGRRSAKVLYIDGEMSRRLLKQRLLAEEARLSSEVSDQVRDQFKPSGFHALSTEDIPNFHPLNTQQGQMTIERIIAEMGGCDFVIFDNVMSLISGSMVDEEAWAQTLPWVKSLTRRGIGQLWVHHTGHDENKGYGTKTREWQMDVVIHLSKVERSDTDVSFKLEFRKARERRPDNREYFQPVDIFLVDDRWTGDASAGSQGAKKASPSATRYFEALLNVVAGGMQPKSRQLHGCHAVHNDDWKAECELLGLLDPKGQKNSQRAKFSNNRTELVVAKMVGCEGEYTWIR